MSVKLADTLAPMGNFAIGESKDIDIEINGTNKRLQQAYEDGDLGGGSSIQVDTMPIASEYPNKIVQFVGESGSYQTGFFYQSISDEQNPPTYSWVQKNVQPSNATATDVSYDNTTSELVATNVQDAIDEIKGGLGTASGKNFTDLVRPNSHELVESGSVYSAINNALSSIYTPRGELTCAELISSLLIEDNVGNIYTMSDSGTTSALFINGAGQTINVNDNVGIIKAGENTYLFNLMGDAFDLHDYQKKELSTTIASATTVEGALSALNNGKVTKHNYTMDGTASLEDDIKTFVTALIALGANTYVGFFNRSGSLGTAGNYNITIYAEEGTSTFASGYIALGAGALGKTQYIVSYYKPTDSSEEWTIKKLAMENDIVTRHNYSVQGTTDAIADTKALVNHIVTLPIGTYAGEFKRSGITFGSYRLTYFIDGIYAKSVSGIVTYSINVDTDATYQVSYVEDIEHGTPPVWKIEKLVTENENIFVKWIGNAEGLTLAQIYNTYSKQNTSMYKGFLDWNDSRCPIYGQGADTVEITCYDWNLTAKSIRGQNYFYDDTNNVWVKNINISQGTLTFPAQTIQSGEYAEVTVPLSVNEFYCGRLDFTNLPSVNLTISYNDFSGLLQDTKSTDNRSQDVLIVVGKATQLILHVYLTNYTGQPVTIGNVDMIYYLEHHIVKE